MFSDLPGHSCIHKFQHQRPTPADLCIWKMALHKISFEFHVLAVPLQEYISPPHDLPWWLLSNYGTILHNMITREDKEYHKMYTNFKSICPQNQIRAAIYIQQSGHGRIWLPYLREYHSCATGTCPTTFDYTSVTFPPHPFLDLSRQLGILPISHCGFLSTTTEIDCGYSTACWKNPW